MNYIVWLNLVTNLAGIVARQSGAAPRELAYLGVLTNAANMVALTDADLAELQAKYATEVANDTPTTASELDAIADRIAARSAEIQSS
jgi:hypothetical protein